MSYLIHDLNNHGFRLCLYTESSNGWSNFLFLLATEQACLWWGFLLLVGCVISLFGGERRGGWCSKWRVQYVEGAQHPGRCPVPGKVCRLCNCSAAALWVWGAQTSWCVLSSPVRQIAGVLWAALHVLEWWLPGITKNPSPTCSIAVIEQKVHKKNCWSTCPEACWSPSPSKWWRGAMQPDFGHARAPLNQKPCRYSSSSSPFKLLTCPVKLYSLALLKWDWRQTCK